MGKAAKHGDEVLENVAKAADDIPGRSVDDLALKHADETKWFDDAAKNAPEPKRPDVPEPPKDVAPKALPSVKKAVNSGLPHATDQAVKKGLATAAERAAVADELRALSKGMGKNGFPKGTVPDPGNVIDRADSVLVPFRDGAAVYEIGKNGTARLQTLLGKDEFATALGKLGQ